MPRDMDSFEELGLAPELVEALAADGLDHPTSLQEAAVPVIRRANNLFLAAGPGSGITVAWGAALLDRLDGVGDTPGVVVLTPSRDRADQLAQSMARLADSVGQTVAALGSHWALPERASMLFGTPADVLAAAKASPLDHTFPAQCLAQWLQTTGGHEQVVTVSFHDQILEFGSDHEEEVGGESPRRRRPDECREIGKAIEIRDAGTGGCAGSPL